MSLLEVHGHSFIQQGSIPPVTPDKDWKYVGKTNPVPLKDVPILVKEMRESFFTHKYLFLYQ